jgi:hypothetical protein
MKTRRTVAISAFTFLLLLVVLPSGAQSTSTVSPAVPKEARKHFVMGMTLFKDAEIKSKEAAHKTQSKTEAKDGVHRKMPVCTARRFLGGIGATH